jgi:CRISPR-associated protein Csb1
MMNDILTKYDTWLNDAGPAALVIREHLLAVDGADGVVFPATYAPGDNFPGGYNIDRYPDGTNVCLIDSVGSQANRIEPLFAAPPYAALVPQIIIKAGENEVNLLAAGHRAGDAMVRCSELQQELQNAFKAILRGDAWLLAKIAPTSLVFGVWDSRGTQAKLPRLVVSTVRAFNVRPLTRSANYLVQQVVDYVKEGLLPEPESETEKKELSKKGYLNALASASHGGVIATGGIRRDANLTLAALRLLAAREANGTLSTDRTQALRRYILGLSLVALSAPQPTYIRQGCNLVPDIERPREIKVVHADGRREDTTLIHADVLAYARVAADAFGVGKSRPVAFDRALAQRDVKGASKPVKGKVTSIDVEARKFTIKPSKTKPEVEVTTTDSTSYWKGNEESTFEEVVGQNAKVEVELSNGVAVKVTRK